MRGSFSPARQLPSPASDLPRPAYRVRGCFLSCKAPILYQDRTGGTAFTRRCEDNRPPRRRAPCDTRHFAGTKSSPYCCSRDGDPDPSSLHTKPRLPFPAGGRVSRFQGQIALPRQPRLTSSGAVLTVPSRGAGRLRTRGKGLTHLPEKPCFLTPLCSRAAGRRHAMHGGHDEAPSRPSRHRASQATGQDASRRRTRRRRRSTREGSVHARGVISAPSKV